MLVKIMYFILLVSDQDKALDFYTKLGFEKRIDYPGTEGRFLTLGAALFIQPAKKGLAREMAILKSVRAFDFFGHFFYKHIGSLFVNSPLTFVKRQISK